MDSDRLGVHISPAEASEIASLHRMITDALGEGIASVDTVMKVHARQRDGIWKVTRANGIPCGSLALLYLNPRGVEALSRGTFCTTEPDMDHLAASPEEATAIFAWCLVLKGKTKTAVIKLAAWLANSDLDQLPLFANPVTPQGARLAASMGLRPLHDDGSTNIHCVI